MRQNLGMLTGLAVASLFLFWIPTSSGQGEDQSPFGFHPAEVFIPGYPESGYGHAVDIGVRWTRHQLYFSWARIQPNLQNPVFNYTESDSMMLRVPSTIQMLANVAPEQGAEPSRSLANSYIPVDVDAYVAFVEATVERYDGDGIGEGDFPGGVFPNPIVYWQVGNEPSDDLRSDFATLQQITYQAIKAASPGAQVLIGGFRGPTEGTINYFDRAYAPILEELAGNYVDIFDFHWFGYATGDYRLQDALTGADALAYIRNALTTNGFSSDIPIWCTENGTYSGLPSIILPIPEQGIVPFQSERAQAGDLFKRCIYSISQGVAKVFPAFGLVEGFQGTDSQFDHTGFIYDGVSFGRGPNPADGGDPGLGVKKLAYYMYKKMSETLEGADWSTLEILLDGADHDDIYLFRVEVDGLPYHIAWWDYFDDSGYTAGSTRTVEITGVAGAEVEVIPMVPAADFGLDVTDYETALASTYYPIIGNTVTIPLGVDPVVVAATASVPLARPALWLLSLVLLALGVLRIRVSFSEISRHS